MPFTLPNTEQSITNPGTQPWKTDSPPLDWLMNLIFPSDPQSAIQGVMGAGIKMPKTGKASLPSMDQVRASLAAAFEHPQVGSTKPTLENLIMDIAKSGENASRNAFKPTLTFPNSNYKWTGNLGDFHGPGYPEVARQNPALYMAMKPGDVEHAFQTEAGTAVPYDVFELLTGPIDTLKRVAKLLNEGTPLETLMSLLK